MLERVELLAAALWRRRGGTHVCNRSPDIPGGAGGFVAGGRDRAGLAAIPIPGSIEDDPTGSRRLLAGRGRSAGGSGSGAATDQRPAADGHLLSRDRRLQGFPLL